MEFQGSRQASGRRFAIVVSTFNKEITDGLLHGARAVLSEAGVKDVDVTLVRVPGAFEIPLAARYLAESGRYDAVVCLGCLIKGDTMHFEYIAEAVSHGIMEVSARYRSARGIRCADHAHRRNRRWHGPRMGRTTRDARPRSRQWRWPRLFRRSRGSVRHDGGRRTTSGRTDGRRLDGIARREAALQMLYQWEVGRVPIDEVCQTFWTGGPAGTPSGRERPRVCDVARDRRRRRMQRSWIRSSPRRPNTGGSSG